MGVENRKYSVYSSNVMGITKDGRQYLRDVLVPALKKQGNIEILDPWESTLAVREEDMPSNPPCMSNEERMKIGVENFGMIDRADFILANLDGRDVDSGVGAEIGYAYAKGKKIIGYYRIDPAASGYNGPIPENIQIEAPIKLSGGIVARNLDDAIKRLQAMIETAPKLDNG